MFPSTKLLDLFEIDLRHRKVAWVDGFDNLAAVIRYLGERGDRDHSYTVVSFGGATRATAFFANDELVLLTSDREILP